MSDPDERPGDPPGEPRLPPPVPPELASPGLLARLRGHVIDVSPLRESRQFRLLWIGETVSDLGSEITAVAVPYQVFRITHSSLDVGLLALCELLPLAILPLVGGAIADAVDRRGLIRLTYSILPLLSLALAANAHLARPHLWALYVFATLSASGYALYSPAVRSLPLLLFERERYPAVEALTSAYYSTVALAGPALAGLLLAWIGLTGAYLFDAATFLLALATASMLGPTPKVEESARAGLRSIIEGLRFLKGKPVLQSTFTVDLNAMIFGFPTALFPAVADRLGGAHAAEVLGVLYAAPYAGSTIVTLLSGRARHIRRQGLAVEVAVAAWGTALVGFGLSSHLWLALLFLALAGGADMWSGIFRTSIGQSLVPDAMRGRLSGIELAVVASGPSLGNVEAGVVASLVSVPFSIVSGGVLCVAGVGLLHLLVPQFHRYDATAPVD